MDARNAVALLSVLSLALLGQRVGSGGFAGGDPPTGLLPPQAGAAAAEHQDDIDASCTGWDFSLGELSETWTCDTSGSRLQLSNTFGTAEGIAQVTHPDLPGNMGASACQMIQVTEDAAGNLSDSRVGFPFGGDPTDQAAGVPMVYLDYAFGAGEPTVQSKWWDGDSWEPPTTEGLCDPGTGGGFLTTGEYLVACIDGTWGSGAQVQLWSFASNPCEGSCASSDLGTPEVTIDEATDCAVTPLTTTGATAGVYGLGTSDMTVFADTYAAWETDPPAPFTSLAVSPSSLSPSMSQGGSEPGNDTLTISNDGNSGEFGGTVALFGTPDNCQPTTGDNTSWPAPADGSFSGATSTVDATESISYAGATGCEEGSYGATLRVTCTTGDDCDDDPQDTGVTLTVNPESSGGPPLEGGCQESATFTGETTITYQSAQGTLVDFTFDSGVTGGRYANGDCWVVGPATLSSITPAASGGRNGWMVNPTDMFAHAFDDRASANEYDAALMPALPYSASAGDSIIKAVSKSSRGNGSFSYLQYAAVLTIVGSAPADAGDTFRPPYVGTAKPTYLVSQLQTGRLAQLVEEGSSVPTLAQVETAFRAPIIDFGAGNFQIRELNPCDALIRPWRNTECREYGAEMGSDNADGVLRLNLDDTLTAKRPALIQVVQRGIDTAHMRAEGMDWSAEAGLFVGRKILVAFAATMLNDTTLLNQLAADSGRNDCTTHSTTCDVHNTYSEDGQIYWSDDADGGAGKVLWGEHLFTWSPSNYLNYCEDITVNESKQHADPHGFIDGGSPGDPGSYQSCCSSLPYKSQAIAAWVIPEMVTAWDNPDFFAYVDRWVTHGFWYAPDPQEAYCSNRDETLDGTSANGGLNSSPFANGMWDAYRTCAESETCAGM